MRLGDKGFPLVILSHRQREYLPFTLASIEKHMTGVSDIIVVDDSGSPEHHQWLDGHVPHYSLSDPSGGNVGYLSAMSRVFEVAREAADHHETDYAMLWEEDFELIRDIDLADMALVMEENRELAQLNLQRQAVYRIERRLGYMESHARRSYMLTKECSTGVEALPWVRRWRPFTTNPGLIQREVLDIEWPDRDTCDAVPGGAEPAMSLVLEEKAYQFGWFGNWNTPHTQHIGTDLKTGIGY